MVLPKLVDILRQKAPNVRLNIVLGPLEDILGAIGQGRADIAIGRFDRLPDRYMTSRLLEDDYVCVMRAGHPLAAYPLTMDAYLQSDHLILHAGGAASDTSISLSLRKVSSARWQCSFRTALRRS